MCVEMSLIGVGNNKSTAFRLGCLFVGLSDPNGSFTLRLRCMGLTLLTTVFFGALLPGLTWRSPAAVIVTAFLVALTTGMSAALQFSDSTTTKHSTLATTLGMALFAINSGVNASTNGYGGLWFSVFWTFVGGSSSLAAALLPEVIGNRDAVRTDLFKVWYGLGMNLRRWKQQWGTVSHFSIQPVPTVTLSVSANEDKVEANRTEEAIAIQWQLSVIKCADRIRTSSLCLSNFYGRNGCDSGNSIGRKMDAFFFAVGGASNRIAFALQFPWLFRYFLRNGVEQAVGIVNKTAAALAILDEDCEENGIGHDSLSWLPSIVELIRSNVQSVAMQIVDDKTWPPYPSFCSLTHKLSAAFPSTLPKFKADPSYAIRGHALRLAIAFTLASVPVVTKKDSWSHWFPMTVAFIMAPSQSATFRKVTHRVIGTLLGLGIGLAMEPLFRFSPALIILLGLNTYAAVLFFPANYALFTIFITGWVYVVRRTKRNTHSRVETTGGLLIIVPRHLFAADYCWSRRRRTGRAGDIVQMPLDACCWCACRSSHVRVPSKST